MSMEEKESQTLVKQVTKMENRALQHFFEPRGTSYGPDHLIAEIALKEFYKGVYENAGENEDKGGRIAHYRECVTDLDCDPRRGPEAWCADFASWVYYYAQKPLGHMGQGFRSVGRMLEWAKEVEIFFRTPERGDIVIIDGDLSGKPDHCGIIVEQPRYQKFEIVTVEGNYGDRVAKVIRHNEDIIVGYVRAWC